MSSRELDARPEADAGGPRFRTMERAWERGGMSELRTHSFGWCLITTSECGGVAALHLSARMVQNVAIRVLMACDESSAECAAARAIRKAVRYLWVICGPGAVAPRRAESETGRDDIISLTSQRRRACDNRLTVVAKVKVGACSMIDDVPVCCGCAAEGSEGR